MTTWGLQSKEKAIIIIIFITKARMLVTLDLSKLVLVGKKI